MVFLFRDKILPKDFLIIAKNRSASICSDSFFLTLESGVDGHRVTAAEGKLVFQPRDDLAGFDRGFELATFHEAFSLGEVLEVVRRLACLGLDIVEICLEGHGELRCSRAPCSVLQSLGRRNQTNSLFNGVRIRCLRSARRDERVCPWLDFDADSVAKPWMHLRDFHHFLKILRLEEIDLILHSKIPLGKMHQPDRLN